LSALTRQKSPLKSQQLRPKTASIKHAPQFLASPIAKRSRLP
jgi:hypothetical protein